MRSSSEMNFSPSDKFKQVVFDHLRLEANARLKLGNITVIMQQIQQAAKVDDLTPERTAELKSLIRNFLRLRYLDERYSIIKFLGREVPLSCLPLNNLTITKSTVVNTPSVLQASTNSEDSEIKSSMIDGNIGFAKNDININIESIFDSIDADSKEIKHVIMYGKPGIGKTIICQRIVNEWAYGRLWFDKFDWIILIYAREFNHKIEGFGSKLGDMINACIFSRSGYTGDCSVETLHKLINSHLKERILFIIDGYDELNKGLNSIYAPVIDNDLLTKNNNSYVLVTARPSYEPQHKFDRILEATGFTGDSIKEYIKVFFTDSKISHDLLIWIDEKKNISKLFCIPIMLELICCLWSDPKEQENLKLDHSLTFTKILKRLIDFLWARYTNKHAPDINNQERILFNKRKKPIRDTLEILAFYGIANNQYVFDGEDISSIGLKPFKAAEQLDDVGDFIPYLDLILESGFMYRLSSVFINRQSYYFIHSTFQEYFAAEYWLSLYNENTTKSYAINLLRQNKYNPRFRIAIIFIAGLLADNSLAYNEFLNILQGEPIDITDNYILNLQILCLNEGSLENYYIRECMTKISKRMFAAVKSKNTFLIKQLSDVILACPRIIRDQEFINAVLNPLKIILLELLAKDPYDNVCYQITLLFNDARYFDNGDAALILMDMVQRNPNLEWDERKRLSDLLYLLIPKNNLPANLVNKIFSIANSEIDESIRVLMLGYLRYDSSEIKTIISRLFKMFENNLSRSGGSTSFQLEIIKIILQLTKSAPQKITEYLINNVQTLCSHGHISTVGTIMMLNYSIQKALIDPIKKLKPTDTNSELDLAILLIKMNEIKPDDAVVKLVNFFGAKTCTNLYKAIDTLVDILNANPEQVTPVLVSLCVTPKEDNISKVFEKAGLKACSLLIDEISRLLKNGDTKPNDALIRVLDKIKYIVPDAANNILKILHNNSCNSSACDKEAEEVKNYCRVTDNNIKDVVPILNNMLEKHDRKINLTIAEFLQYDGIILPGQISELLFRLLNSDDVHVAVLAAMNLARTSEATSSRFLDILRRMLTETKQNAYYVEESVVNILKSVGKHSPDIIIPFLCQQLNNINLADSSKITRYLRALAEISRMNANDIFPTIRNLIDSPAFSNSSTLVKSIIYLIGEVNFQGDQKRFVSEYLMSQLNSQDLDVKISTVSSLVKLQDPIVLEQIPFLLSLIWYDREADGIVIDDDGAGYTANADERHRSEHASHLLNTICNTFSDKVIDILIYELYEIINQCIANNIINNLDEDCEEYCVMSEILRLLFPLVNYYTYEICIGIYDLMKYDFIRDEMMYYASLKNLAQSIMASELINDTIKCLHWLLFKAIYENTPVGLCFQPDEQPIIFIYERGRYFSFAISKEKVNVILWFYPKLIERIYKDEQSNNLNNLLNIYSALMVNRKIGKTTIKHHPYGFLARKKKFKLGRYHFNKCQSTDDGQEHQPKNSTL